MASASNGQALRVRLACSASFRAWKALWASARSTRRVLDHLLWRVAPSRAGDVAGGNGDEIASLAGRQSAGGWLGSLICSHAKRCRNPPRAEQVDLNRIIEGRVEADGGGRVHGDVDGAEECEPGVVKAEAVLTDVAFHCEHSTVAHLVEGLAVQTASCDGVLLERITESVEGVVLENVALTRCSAPRRPGRTSSTSSQSGTERRKRSTSAVPRKPVEPVMAIRVPDRFSLITRRTS